jgi:hypothetical protein
MSYEYKDSLPGDALARYNAKLEAVGLLDCPYRLTQTSWINNPTQWPHIEFGNIYNYLIKSPSKFHCCLLFASVVCISYAMECWMNLSFPYSLNNSVIELPYVTILSIVIVWQAESVDPDCVSTPLYLSNSWWLRVWSQVWMHYRCGARWRCDFSHIQWQAEVTTPGCSGLE